MMIGEKYVEFMTTIIRGKTTCRLFMSANRTNVNTGVV